MAIGRRGVKLVSCLPTLLLVACWAQVASALEHVVLRQDGEEVSVAGRLLVTAEDDGMLLLSADGALWTVPPEDLVRHKHDDEPMKPLSSEQLAGRMTMYDLTRAQAVRRSGDKRGSAAEINQMLARPEAERLVATVIHEATHQIAFNCGLQTRYTDIPIWLSEGIAMYFETPDLASSKGWRTIGAVNQSRLAGFGEYLRKHRPADSLATLLSSDDRLRDREQFEDAYAEAWALNYFLLRQRRTAPPPDGRTVAIKSSVRRLKPGDRRFIVGILPVEAVFRPRGQ